MKYRCVKITSNLIPHFTLSIKPSVHSEIVPLGFYKGSAKCSCIIELGVWLVGATPQKVAIAKSCFIWHAYPSYAEAIITFGL